MMSSSVALKPSITAAGAAWARAAAGARAARRSRGRRGRRACRATYHAARGAGDRGRDQAGWKSRGGRATTRSRSGAGVHGGSRDADGRDRIPRAPPSPAPWWRRATRSAPWPGPARRGMCWTGVPVEYCPGDLTDPASLAAAVRGCAAVIHCAADYRIWVPIRPHDRGERGGDRGGDARGAGRGLRPGGACLLRRHAEAARRRRPATEADAARPDEAIGPYKRSKTEAERLVERLVAEAGCLPSSSTPPPRSARATAGRRRPGGSSRRRRWARCRPMSIPG